MATFRLEGINLRYVNVKDYDRYLTILTPDRGLQELFARRARRTRGPLTGRTDLFVSGTWMGYARGDHYYVDQVDIRYTFPGLSREVTRLTAGTHIAALLRQAAVDPGLAETLYETAHYSLFALEKSPEPDLLRITAATDLYVLDRLGLLADPDHCGICGVPLDAAALREHRRPTVRYDHYSGHFLCPRHHGRKDPTTGMTDTGRYPRNILHVLRHVQHRNPADYLNFRVDPGTMDALFRFAKRELMLRLERDWPNLRELETLLLAPGDEWGRLVQGIAASRRERKGKQEDPTGDAVDASSEERAAEAASNEPTESEGGNLTAHSPQPHDDPADGPAT